MYYPHFGLTEPPFKITPNTDFFFSGGNRGAVLDALVYAITNGEGIIKVVGEVGSGKTMLCRMLQTILPEKIESIYLANPSVAPEDVLHAIAFELQLDVPPNADRLKVMHLLQAHLLNRYAEGRQVVIFVEEAQGMPLATLEEIRLLSNLETKQDKLLQIVLFGQPELDVNLSQTHIRQLRERITHSFHLEPLVTKDIGEYLMLRLRAAGYHGPHLFSEPAIKKLASAAQGLARRVNILADKALLAAYADNVYQVTPKHVQAAIQDSEFGRKTSHNKQYFGVAILLVSLLAAAIGFVWWQTQVKHTQTNASTTTSQAANKAAVVADAAAVSPQTILMPATTVAANPIAISPAATNPVATSATPASPASANAVSASLVSEPSATQPQPAVQAAAQSPLPAKAVENPKVKVLENTKSLVDQRLEITQSILFSAQPSAMTLQIKSLPVSVNGDGEQNKNAHIKAELDQLSQALDINKIYLYRKKQNGALFTAILYGEFATRNEALTALKNLPAAIKNNHPFLRTFASVNQDSEK